MIIIFGSLFPETCCYYFHSLRYQHEREKRQVSSFFYVFWSGGLVHVTLSTSWYVQFKNFTTKPRKIGGKFIFQFLFG